MAANVFSTQLQKLRKAKGVKQEQLAEHLGVSTQAVSKWENGSYPDGDLLPKIAAFFDVSIDYLYGNETSSMCLEQQVEEYLRKKKQENDDGLTSLDRYKEFLWAMQGAENSDFSKEYSRYKVRGKERGIAGSGVMLENGFTYMRMTEDLEYYCLLQLPEEGLESYFADTKELARLFELLAKEENLRILFYMCTMGNGERVRAETVAKSLNLSVESVKDCLEAFSELGETTEFLTETKLVLENGEEKIYGFSAFREAPLLLILAAAKDILHCISVWHGLNWGTNGWMKRAKVLELFKAEEKKEQEGHE